MQHGAAKATVEKSGKVDFEKISASPNFQQLKKQKISFILPLAIVFLALYITLPILTSYTKVLHQPAFGDITWVWIYSLSLFVMTWFLSSVYIRKAAKFDASAQEILDENNIKGGE